MALPNGDLITTVFDPQMAYPVDKRMQIDTLNSRDSISMFIRWEGMDVYVLENKTKYILQGGVSNEYWKPYGIGSGTGGTTFVGQFETADLLPTSGRSAGDYAFVGTGEDFVQYNWDNISGQWVMAEGQTDMASEFFHIGYKTPIRRPVIFPLFPKDVLVETSGDFVFAPETAVARFIFTGEVTAIRGIETAASDREIKLVNRTGSDIPLRDKASGIPSGSGMDFGGTDYTWVNGSEITLKGNGTYWELAPNNQVAFSDHLDSVNAQVSVGSDGLDVFYNILNNHTKQITSYKKTNIWIDGSSMNESKVDGIIYVKIKNQYCVDTDVDSTKIFNCKKIGILGVRNIDYTDRFTTLFILLNTLNVAAYHGNNITLLIPSGHYLIKESLPTINFKIKGEGVPETRIYFNPVIQDQVLFKMSPSNISSTSVISYSGISDMYISGDTPGIRKTGVQLYNLSLSNFSNITIRFDTGDVSSESIGFEISGVELSNFTNITSFCGRPIVFKDLVGSGRNNLDVVSFTNMNIQARTLYPCIENQIPLSNTIFDGHQWWGNGDGGFVSDSTVNSKAHASSVIIYNMRREVTHSTDLTKSGVHIVGALNELGKTINYSRVTISNSVVSALNKVNSIYIRNIGGVILDNINGSGVTAGNNFIDVDGSCTYVTFRNVIYQSVNLDVNTNDLVKIIEQGPTLNGTPHSANYVTPRDIGSLAFIAPFVGLMETRFWSKNIVCEYFEIYDLGNTTLQSICDTIKIEIDAYVVGNSAIWGKAEYLFIKGSPNVIHLISTYENGISFINEASGTNIFRTYLRGGSYISVQNMYGASVKANIKVFYNKI